jgi:hypothetical protein
MTDQEGEAGREERFFVAPLLRRTEERRWARNGKGEGLWRNSGRRAGGSARSIPQAASKRS